MPGAYHKRTRLYNTRLSLPRMFRGAGVTEATGGITISLQLEVQANNKVFIPGCEPVSSISSKTLASYMAKCDYCENPMVDVDLILEEIPGTYLKLGNNFGRGNMRQKWLVFPSLQVGCPCGSYDNWYERLKELEGDPVVEEDFEYCNTTGMGYCPSPDFDTVPEPPADPYKEEGEFPPGQGILPPIPPWADC